MKTLEIHRLESVSEYPALEEISKQLDKHGSRVMIDTINWKEFGYKPEVAVSAAYGEHEIFLKYYVAENYFKAEKTETNQMVCEDSCVEFFVSPGNDGIYYNMEFNAIGTCLLGCGTGRADSKRVDPEIVAKIRRLTTEGVTPFNERTGENKWAITVAVPFDVFFRHKITGLKGKRFRANFYKCGDKLSVPHYLTWNPVGTVSPDYHRPEYFGELHFI